MYEKKVANTHITRTRTEGCRRPKVTQLLTKKEAENGLEIVIERIVEDVRGEKKRFS